MSKFDFSKCTKEELQVEYDREYEGSYAEWRLHRTAIEKAYDEAFPLTEEEEKLTALIEEYEPKIVAAEKQAREAVSNLEKVMDESGLGSYLGVSSVPQQYGASPEVAEMGLNARRHLRKRFGGFVEPGYNGAGWQHSDVC